MVVVFPAPFGPSRLKISPFSTSKLTPCTAFRSPKALCRFLTSMAFILLSFRPYPGLLLSKPG